jgi:RimJ/RimL family protein N-acetyltransferase
VSAFAQDGTIATERLLLTPLRPEDADGLVEVLADPRLHQFIGGRPAALDELRARYTRLAAGSSRPDEVRRNWAVRRRAHRQPVGTVQATLIRHDEGRPWTAQVAWVIGVAWQRQGFASEAARALVGWLGRHGVGDVVAHIHPEHVASMGVAARAGFRPTHEEVDGERVWRVSHGGR